MTARLRDFAQFCKREGVIYPEQDATSYGFDSRTRCHAMPAESTVYRWLKRSREAEVLRQTLQRVDLEREFQEFLQEKYTRARATTFSSM